MTQSHLMTPKKFRSSLAAAGRKALGFARYHALGSPQGLGAAGEAGEARETTGLRVLITEGMLYG